MTTMIVGLLIFLGMHSVRIFADDWRSAQIRRIGPMPWKAIHAVVSVIGLALAIWGYGQMRADPVILWSAPFGLRHVTALLMVAAFVLAAAAYTPRNHIRARLGHPLLLAVKTWALAHLLVNGRVGDIVFFGAFLAWAVLAFRAARQRDRSAGAPQPAASPAGTAAAVVVGAVLYYAFAAHLHVWVSGGVPAFPGG